MLGAMIALVIITLFLISNVGADFSFDSESKAMELAAKALGLTIKIPLEGKKKRAKRPKAATKRPAEAPAPKKEKEKPDWDFIFMIVKNGIETLKRVRRKLAIDILVLQFKAATPDAARTALLYGRVNAALGALFPIIDTALNVREREIETAIDFTSEKSTIYLRVVAVFQVWELLYIGGAFAVALLKYKFAVR